MKKSTPIHFTITNFVSLLARSSITLAATDPTSHSPHPRLFLHNASIQIAAAIEPCRPGELICNDGCMPPRAECCPDGDGYCKQGYACVTDGCCPFGKVCDGRIVCDLGEVPCGDTHCMPEGAVCCVGGSYCRAGETCFQNGFERYCQGAATEGTETSSISKATSSHDQSTSTRMSHGEASIPASTSSSEHESKPVILPTLHLSAASALSSVETPSATSSAPEPTTSPNGNAATAVKMSGLELLLALVLIAMGGL
ncbi:hypothetical protein ACQKWADRAFT_279326 [Trichoderma austrokoningii]